MTGELKLACSRRHCSATPLKEGPASLDCLLRFSLTMHTGGHIFGKQPLGGALARIPLVLRECSPDLSQCQEGEKLQVTLDVPIVGVDPELVELVGTGSGRVEPYVAGLALPEFRTGGVGDEGKHQAIRLLSLPFADQLDAGSDVAPLVTAPKLKLASFGPE